MMRITYCAAGVWSTVEKCARHSDNLCLHLSYPRKDVRVKWVAPCEISIYLGIKERNKQELFVKNEKREFSRVLLTVANTKNASLD